MCATRQCRRREHCGTFVNQTPLDAVKTRAYAGFAVFPPSFGGAPPLPVLGPCVF